MQASSIMHAHILNLSSALNRTRTARLHPPAEALIQSAPELAMPAVRDHALAVCSTMRRAQVTVTCGVARPPSPPPDPAPAHVACAAGNPPQKETCARARALGESRPPCRSALHIAELQASHTAPMAVQPVHLLPGQSIATLMAARQTQEIAELCWPHVDPTAEASRLSP